jgi:glycosyltransferase involved in cell wall biosynthesis
MRILFLVRSLGLGGAETQLAYLARGLHDKGHSVQVTTLYDGGRIWDSLVSAGVVCTHLHKRSRWDLLSPLRMLIDTASSFRPDVIYSFMPAANVFSALARSRLLPAAVVWGVRSARVDWDFYGVAPVLLARLEGWLSSRANLIICNSEAGKQYHAGAGWNEARMIVVENGFDLDEFFPDAAAGAQVRAELRVSPQTRVVGIVGRIDPIKDHPSFLRMAAAVLSKHRTCEFWCVGAGTGDGYLERMQDYARSLGISDSVRWLGPRRDMRAVYSAMDVTCLTSLAEGFPNVVGESMACGTPCVAFDVGDAARIVQDRDLVIPERSHEQLAAAVLRVLGEDGSLRGRVRDRIASNYSLSRCVERTEECLSQVALGSV